MLKGTTKVEEEDKVEWDSGGSESDSEGDSKANNYARYDKNTIKLNMM